MRLVGRIYDAVLYGMAWFAGALMVVMMVTICLDVVLRNLGYQSSAHFFTFSEYALLLIPCLGAPWLVREKGHIYVEIVLMQLGRERRQALIRLIGVICVVVCLVLAWYGGEVTVRNFVQRDMDVRSLDMPRWLIVVFIPLSFGMMAFEFLRFLARGESVIGSMISSDPREPE